MKIASHVTRGGPGLVYKTGETDAMIERPGPAAAVLRPEDPITNWSQ